MKKKNPYISDITTSDIILDREAREPGFKARMDAHLEQLAIARQVRHAREKRKLTQAELAVRAGTGQAAIARIENGTTIPKFDLLSRIAGALDAEMNVTLKLRRA